MLKSLLIVSVTVFFAHDLFADQIRFLESDVDALQARVDLIQQAKNEIFVEYYSITADDTSTATFALLRDAAHRGVKVKILVDALASSMKRETVEAVLRGSFGPDGKQNLELRIFNPLNPVRLGSLSKRDHSKMLNVDGSIMIIGGRNIDGAYYGVRKWRSYIDLDVVVGGNVALAGKINHQQLWNSVGDVKEFNLYEMGENHAITGDTCINGASFETCAANAAYAEKKINAETKKMDMLIKDITDVNAKLFLNTRTDWLKNSFQTPEIRFIHDSNSEPVSASNSSVSDEIFRVMSQAKNDVVILTPYLIPTPRAGEMLTDLRARNVPVKIITNSLKSTDNFLSQGAYHSRKQDMINLGIELYEYNEPITEHAKAAVVDDTILVGTYNMDPRSKELNREIGIIIENDHAIAQELRRIIQVYQDKSLLVGKDGKVQNLDQQDQNIPLWKRSAMKAAELALPLIYNSL